MKKLILFDLENQLDEIERLNSWRLRYDFNYAPYQIKVSPEGFTLDQTDLFIVLIGASTRYLSIQFKEDVEHIIATQKPILCFNLNGVIGLDEENCPIFLHDAGAVHMPFTKEDVEFSIDNIKTDARIINPNQSYHFRRNQRPWNAE